MRKFGILFAAAASIVIASPAAAQIVEPTVKDRPAAPALTDTENHWILDLSTGGRVTIALRPDVAPKHVERIKTLTRQKFYDGLSFHRVLDTGVPMAQGGDPKGDGTGQSTLPDVEAEFNWMPHVRGAVSAARSGAPDGAPQEVVTAAENSANSQFFIMFQPMLSLDKKYTVFGRVISGMQYVDAIPRGEPPANPARIVRAYIGSDNPPAYVAPAPSAPVLPAGEQEVTLPGT